MALYLSRFSYTTDAKKALLNQPQDRSAAAREMAESLGGKLLGFWYAFGEFDGVFLMEAPDNASAVAVGMAVGAVHRMVHRSSPGRPGNSPLSVFRGGPAFGYWN